MNRDSYDGGIEGDKGDYKIPTLTASGGITASKTYIYYVSYDQKSVDFVELLIAYKIHFIRWGG